MKVGATSYRTGEHVWVNQGGSLAPAVLVSNARRQGHYTDIEVEYADGNQEIQSVDNVYRPGPEVDAWLALFDAQGPILRALTEVCHVNGFTFGGKACRETAEWAAYEANQAQIRVAGQAVAAGHPYRT